MKRFLLLLVLTLPSVGFAVAPGYTFTGTTVNGSDPYLPRGISFGSTSFTVNVSVKGPVGASYYIVYESAQILAGSTTVGQVFNNPSTNLRTGNGSSFVVPSSGTYDFSYTAPYAFGGVNAGGGPKTSGQVTLPVWRQTLKLYSSSNVLLDTQYFEIGGDVFNVVSSGSTPAIAATIPGQIAFDTSPPPSPTPTPSPTPVPMDVNGSMGLEGFDSVDYEILVDMDNDGVPETRVQSGNLKKDDAFSFESSGKAWVMKATTGHLGEVTVPLGVDMATGHGASNAETPSIELESRGSVITVGPDGKHNVEVTTGELVVNGEPKYVYSAPKGSTTVYQSSGASGVTAGDLREAVALNGAQSKALLDELKGIRQILENAPGAEVTKPTIGPSNIPGNTGEGKGQQIEDAAWGIDGNLRAMNQGFATGMGRAPNIQQFTGQSYTLTITLPVLGTFYMDLSPYSAYVNAFRDFLKFVLGIIAWVTSVRTIRSAFV